MVPPSRAVVAITEMRSNKRKNYTTHYCFTLLIIAPPVVQTTQEDTLSIENTVARTDSF